MTDTSRHPTYSTETKDSSNHRPSQGVESFSEMLDLLDALDKMPSHSSTTKSYLGRAWAWAMFWLLGDVLATNSSFRGRNRAWSAINSKLPHLELHHRAFRWFVPVPQALDPQLDAGDLQRSAVHSSNGAVSGRLHQSSVAPLFKGFSFCDWPIAKGAHVPGRVGRLELGVVPGNTLDGGVRKQKSALGEVDMPTWPRVVEGQESLLLRASRRQVNDNTTDQVVSSGLAQSVLIPGKRPRKTPSKPTLSIQLGSPFV